MIDKRAIKYRHIGTNSYFLNKHGIGLKNYYEDIRDDREL